MAAKIIVFHKMAKAYDKKTVHTATNNSSAATPTTDNSPLATVFVSFASFAVKEDGRHVVRAIRGHKMTAVTSFVPFVVTKRRPSCHS